MLLALCWSLPAIALSLPARSLAAGPPSGLNVTVSNTEIESTISESGNIVTTWGGIAADAIARSNEAAATLNTPGVGLMLMAQVQLAVYDVMVALKEGKFEPFSRTTRRPMAIQTGTRPWRPQRTACCAPGSPAERPTSTLSTPPR